MPAGEARVFEESRAISTSCSSSAPASHPNVSGALFSWCGFSSALNLNEWDYIRFGTIAAGEQIIGADPPSGSTVYDPAFNSFTVTFDAPNFVHIDDITVEVTGGDAPVVARTWRRENDGPETVEIVLDRPMPIGETTTFTFDDGVAVNVVRYTLIDLGPIPAVSEWSLAILTLLTMTTGTLLFRKRGRTAVSARLTSSHL